MCELFEDKVEEELAINCENLGVRDLVQEIRKLSASQGTNVPFSVTPFNGYTNENVQNFFESFELACISNRFKKPTWARRLPIFPLNHAREIYRNLAANIKK